MSRGIHQKTTKRGCNLSRSKSKSGKVTGVTSKVATVVTAKIKELKSRVVPVTITTTLDLVTVQLVSKVKVKKLISKVSKFV